MSPRPTPLYRDGFALCDWLLQHFGEAGDALGRGLAETGLALLKAIVLALKAPQPDDYIEMADEHLIVLRTWLRLAHTRSRIDEDQLLYALEQADRIGRQIGGWLRALEAR
jgi:hypothetical protein